MTPQDALREYERLINHHSFDELLPLISADATFWFSDGTHSGIDDIREAFERTWRQIGDEVYWLEDLTWIAVGDTAASCIYRFHWKGLWNGRATEGQGRGTTVLRRDGAAWRIVHEHLSPIPKEKQPA